MSRTAWAAIFLAAAGGFLAAIYALGSVGTCASGGPYVVENECPGGTGWWIALLLGSAVAIAVSGMALGAVWPERPSWWRRRGGLIPLFIFVPGTVECAAFSVLIAVATLLGAFAPWSDASHGAQGESAIFAGGFAALGIGGWFVGRWLARLANEPRSRR